MSSQPDSRLLPFPRLANLFTHNAQKHAESVALEFNDELITYRELNARADAVANGLAAEGVKAGSRIGYLAKNHAAFFELLGGAAKSRVALMSLNWRLAPPEMAYVLEDAAVDLLFVGAEYYDVAVELVKNLKGLRKVIALEDGHPTWPSYKSWRDAQSREPLDIEPQPDDDVLLIYTSGTTGRPKGVQLTNNNYDGFFRQVEAAPWGRWTSKDVSMVILPLYHVAGINVGLVSLAWGAHTVVHEDVDLARIAADVPRVKVTKLFLVPALILFLTLTPEALEADLSSLTLIFYGSSPISQDVLAEGRKLFKCAFVQVYGLTETNGAATHLTEEDHDPALGLLESCGKPNEGCEVRIMGEGGKEAPAGEVGEIQIRSQALMKGYWGLPEATSEVIDEEGWFSTGDAGYLNEQGYVFVHDRLKDMIISGGENVYPAEVENALESSPDVREAAAVGVPDEKWGEAVKAFVTPSEGVERNEETALRIIEHVRGRIASYKAPKSVEFVDALPRNPTGKVLRRELRAPYWEGRARSVS